MSTVSLVDSTQLSALLKDALSWNSTATSLLVSARNGSILAYAFRNATPSIKALRTRSTTMTAAYLIASEQVLVFEAQNSSALTVISPIADHLLLAVTGPEPSNPDPYEQHVLEALKKSQQRGTGRNGTGEEETSDEEEEETGDQVRQDLEALNQEVASILREELKDMKWPEDI